MWRLTINNICECMCKQMNSIELMTSLPIARILDIRSVYVDCTVCVDCEVTVCDRWWLSQTTPTQYTV